MTPRLEAGIEPTTSGTESTANYAIGYYWVFFSINLNINNTQT